MVVGFGLLGETFGVAGGGVGLTGIVVVEVFGGVGVVGSGEEICGV